MASEEMVEELEKAIEELQLKVSDMQTTYSSTERNTCSWRYIKKSKLDERGTISGVQGSDFKHQTRTV